MQAVFDRAVANGATIVQKPHKLFVNEEDESAGFVELATVSTPYGQWYHTLVDTTHLPKDMFLPGFEPVAKDNNDPEQKQPQHLHCIDHIAIAIEKDKVREVVEWYGRAFQFERYFNDDEDDESGLTVEKPADNTGKAATPNGGEQGEGGGLRTMVVRPARGELGDHVDDSIDEDYLSGRNFKFVFVEPINIGHQRSQVQEFIDFHGGTGVAHLALYADDIVGAVSSAASRGIKFIDVPHTYYEIWCQEKSEAHGLVQEDWSQLEQWKVRNPPFFFHFNALISVFLCY